MTTRRRRPRWSELRPLVRIEPPSVGSAERRVSAAATIGDLRRIAKRRTPRSVFDYVDGAAEQEISLRRAREAFLRVEFRPRVLRDVSEVDASRVVVGSRSTLPLVLAPTGFTRMMHHEGERAVARAASPGLSHRDRLRPAQSALVPPARRRHVRAARAHLRAGCGYPRAAQARARLSLRDRRSAAQAGAADVAR